MKSFDLDIRNLKKCYYLYDYLPKNKFSQDQKSKLILDFKDNEGSAVLQWCIEASKACGLKFARTNIDVIIRVLGHDELEAGKIDLPLDKLGRNISRAINASYQPEILYKSSTNKSLKFLGKEGRENELHQKYNFKNVGNISNLSILIIDDITTTGSTIKEVCRAIMEQVPQAKLYFFALGKTKTKQNFVPESKIPLDDLEFLKKQFSNPKNEITKKKKIKRKRQPKKKNTHAKFLNGELEPEIKNAYSKWTIDEEKKLTSLFLQGKSTKEISIIMKRQTGGINARIKKLGLRDI